MAHIPPPGPQVPPDPSSTIAPDLLPHVHLVSTYRYPLQPRVDLTQVAKWLLEAPKIARDKNGFYWTYLEKPQDGTILLTWQPLRRLGTEFATDGYLWPPMEAYHQQELPGGVTVEIYYHKAGFNPGENYATHCRRRFRLVPPKIPIPNAPQVDPSLWIVHWGPVETPEPIPVTILPFDPRLQQLLHTRAYLQKCGQIHRKEFMLSDKVNWPTLSFPTNAGPRYGQPPGGTRPVPQQMAYPPHPHGPMGHGPPGGPPNKRMRPGPGPGQHPGGPPHQGPPQGHVPPMPEHVFEDEEDTSRGDVFDTMTNRDIAMARYQQNHDWMEEVLSSPYAIGRIVPPELGLTLKGELAPLTEGIFPQQQPSRAPGAPGGGKTAYPGRLDPAMAREFRKRVEEKVKAVEAEIEEMQARQDRILARFGRTSIISQAEKELRALHTFGSRSADLNADGEDEDGGAGGVVDLAAFAQDADEIRSAEEIIADVEATLGRKAVEFPEVLRVQDGGYLEPQPEPEPEPEPVPEQLVIPPAQPAPAAAAAAAAAGQTMEPAPAAPPSQNSMSRQASMAGSLVGGADSDIDMGGTAAGLLDQMHPQSATSTPMNSFPTPQPLQGLSAIPSAAGTPTAVLGGAANSAPSPLPGMGAAPAPAGATGNDGDVKMAGMEDAAPSGQAAGDQADDWVVVPQGGVSPPAGATAPAGKNGDGSTPGAGAAQQASSASAGVTPAVDFGGDGDPGDFGSLEDLDTAGDALAAFGDGGNNGDDDGDEMGRGGESGADGAAVDLGMDDSAFGDAFHPVDDPGHASGSPRDVL